MYNDKIIYNAEKRVSVPKKARKAIEGGITDDGSWSLLITDSCHQ